MKNIQFWDGHFHNFLISALFLQILALDSFCCWTFKSRSRNSVRWCNTCSSLYSTTSLILYSRLITQSPIIWYIVSNLSPLYNLNLMLCCSANWCKSLIILITFLNHPSFVFGPLFFIVDWIPNLWWFFLQ